MDQRLRRTERLTRQRDIDAFYRRGRQWPVEIVAIPTARAGLPPIDRPGGDRRLDPARRPALRHGPPSLSQVPLPAPLEAPLKRPDPNRLVEDP